MSEEIGAETGAVQDDLQAVAARIRRLSKEQVDAASTRQMKDLLDTVTAARRALEAERRRVADVPAAAEPKPEPEVPVDDSPTVEERAREIRLNASRAEIEELRRTIARGDLPRLRTAAEYRSWSDDRLAMLRMDPEERLAVQLGVPFDDLGRVTNAPDFGYEQDDEAEFLDASPLLIGVERLEIAQRQSNEADAQRVAAALQVWRTADALATGTPNAALNGPYRNGVMLQIAHSLQIAEQTASALVNAADDLETKLPRTWHRFVAGEVPWRGMQKVHAAIEGLDPEYLPAFDEQAAEYVVRVSLPQLRDRLRKLAERLQASTAAERHKRALTTMRVELEPAADGMAWVSALLPAAEAVQIDRLLDLAARQAAAEDPEGRSIGVLRALIFGDVFAEWLGQDASTDRDTVLVPQRRGVQCKVGLLIPAMTALGHSDVPAQLEGYGPIDIETAKLLAGAASSWIKVLTDPVTGAVWDIGRDKYRPTSDMRALLGLLDGGGRGPGCTRPPSQTEADHVEPFWQHFSRGQTALDNLVLLGRRHHRIKTSGMWDIELRRQRDLAWTSMIGTRIITTVEPLEPTPVPERFLRLRDPVPAEWADPGATDDLDAPF